MIARAHRLATVTFVLLCSLSAFSGDVLICRKPGIHGKEASAARAHKFLPPTTSDISKAVIYVENTPDGFYFHSNFKTRGFDEPTKALIKKDADFKTIFLNLIYDDFNDDEAMTALGAYKRQAKILLDESMFTEGGYPRIDVGDATNVGIVDGRNGKFLLGPVDRLDRVDPPPVLMSRVVGCCLFGIPPHLAGSYQQALEARPLVKSNVRFLSLVKDTGTDTAIHKSTILHAARLGEPGQSITSLAQIETVFQSARGSTVVLVSHVEGEKFVIRDAGRNILSSIPIESVRSLASKYNIELVDLGCETAQRLRAEKLGIGVTTKFNTVDAVNALERALSKSSNYSEFFQALTSEDLKVVVDRGFIQHWPLCADVYAKTSSRSMWVKLARVFVNFREPGKAMNSFGEQRFLGDAIAVYDESYGQ